MAIDVASGSVSIYQVDVLVEGKVQLNWERGYSSQMAGSNLCPLGPGWMVGYFSMLTQADGGFVFLSPEGESHFFEVGTGSLDYGGVVRSFETCQELTQRDSWYLVTRWDVETGEIERFGFEKDERSERLILKVIEDVCGRTLDLSYDSQGRLSSVRQRTEGRSLRLAYNNQGQLQFLHVDSSSSSSLKTIGYEYDAQGRLNLVRDPAGHVEQYEYDQTDRISRHKSCEGQVTQYNYDDSGRCVRTSASEHFNEKTLKYWAAVNTTLVTDSNGNTATYKYNATGQVFLAVDALGNPVTTDFDQFGRVIQITNPNGGSQRYEYDEYGNRSAIIDAIGNTFRIFYNKDHLVTKVINPKGDTWIRRYDNHNRLVAATNPLGAEWTLEYDVHGNATLIRSPTGSVIKQKFEAGQVVDKTDWENHHTVFEYDALGRVSKRIDPLGNITQIHYDALDNATAVTLPDGSQLQAEYDCAGNLTSFVEGNGTEVKFRYGSCNRLLERIDALGSITQFHWGTEPEQLEEVINEQGESQRFYRNEVGFIVREKSFDGRVRRFEYDKNGNQVATINASGQRLEFEYDLLDQLVSQRFPEGVEALYQYDSLGNVTRAQNDVVAIDYQYDAIGNVLLETQGDAWVRSTYNLCGHLIETQTSWGHEVLFKLDGNGYPERMTLPNGQSTSFERDARGQEVGRQMTRGFRLEQEYNSMGRLVRQNAGLAPLRDKFEDWAVPGNKNGLARTYGYDRAGSIIRIQDSLWGEEAFVYDPVDQVIESVRSKRPSEFFQYDAAGNLKPQLSPQTATDILGEIDSAAGNRVTRVGDSTFEYDADGRRVRRIDTLDHGESKTWTYEWDSFDRLRRATLPTGEIWEYRYDAFGRRIEKVGPSGKQLFLWDRDLIIQENQNGHTSTWIYDHVTFAPLATIQHNELMSVVCDHLGTPREVLDASARIRWSAHYLTWGEADQIEEDFDVTCPIRFQGQWFDSETGLHYNRFRYYDPISASFISHDPLGLGGGVNQYAYAPNPLNWLDPFGLAAKCVNNNNRGRGYTIYVIRDKKGGKIIYVGYTPSHRFDKRMKEHKGTGRLSGSRVMERHDHADNYGQARGFEQAYIQHYGTLAPGTAGKSYRANPGNRCLSYSESRTDARATNFQSHNDSKTNELAGAV